MIHNELTIEVVGIHGGSHSIREFSIVSRGGTCLAVVVSTRTTWTTWFYVKIF